MSDHKNPPAFPVPWEYAANETGMSLRDWFAGKALPFTLQLNREYVAKFPDPKYQFATNSAREAYEIADAMLAAREQKA